MHSLSTPPSLLSALQAELVAVARDAQTPDSAAFAHASTSAVEALEHAVLLHASDTQTVKA